MSDPWAEFTPVEKKADDPWAEFKPVEQPGTLETIGNALRYGASKALSGPAETLKEQHADGTIGAGATQLLDQGANLVAPQDYKPAGDIVADKKLSLWERAKALPRSLLESSPGMAADLAAGWAGSRVGGIAGLAGGPFAEVTAPAGAIAGGLLGFGGSYLLRNFGNDAKGSAVSRTGDPGATPNSEDERRALAAGTAGALLSRLGLGGAMGTAVKAAGGSAIGQVAKQAVGAAGLDAATAGVSDAIHQDLIDRTQQTPADAALAAFGGAGTGLAVRGTLGTKDIATASRFKDIEKANPESAARVAGAMEDTSNKQKSFDSIKKLDTQLRSDLDEASKDSYIGPQLKALGPQDDTGFALNKVKDQVRQGITVDQSDIDTLKDRLGHTDEGQKLTTTLEDLNTLNQLKSKGTFDTSKGTFDAGLRTVPFVKNVISPFSKWGQRLDATGIGLVALGKAGIGHSHMILGMEPTGVGLGLAGGLTGTYAGLKGIDKLTGADNLANGFKNRFSDPNAAQQPQLPSFRQGIVDDAAANAAAEQKLRNLGRTAVIMSNSQKLAQQQADAPLAQARQTSQLMQNSQNLAARQAAAALQAPAFTSKMMNADAGNQAKAQKSLEQAVQEAEAAKQQRINQALGAAKATAALQKNSAALEQKQADAPLAEAKRTSQLMTNSQGLEQRQTAQEQAAKEREFNRALAVAKWQASLQRNSETPDARGASDAIMPLRVARLKQSFADAAERARSQEDARTEFAANQREDTLAALQSLHEGDGSEERFQARKAELDAKRAAPKKPPMPVDPTKYTNIDPQQYNSLLGKSTPVNNNRTPGHQKALDEHDSIMERWDAAHQAVKDAESVLGRGTASEFELAQAHKKLNDAHDELVKLVPRMQEPDPYYEPTIREHGGLQNVVPKRIDGHFSSEGPREAANDKPGPKAPLDPHKYITLTDGGEHTVQRTTEGVMKPNRYQAGGNTRMQTRTQAVDAMKAEAPGYTAALNSMLRDLNRNATTRAEGKRLLEEHLNDMPADVQATVRKHIKDEFWQTWKKIGK